MPTRRRIFAAVFASTLTAVLAGSALAQPRPQGVPEAGKSERIDTILKRGTLRPRPYEVVQAVAPGAAVLDSFSFPSGHTLHAVAFTILFGAYYPVLLAPLVAFTLLTAASRGELGLHYPSDVLAGAAIGAALAGLSFGI